MITKQERLNALENQIGRLQRRVASLNRRSERYSWIRLAIFLAGALLSVVTFLLIGWLWGIILGAVTLIVFAIVAHYHRKIDRSITRHKILLEIKAAQVARIKLDWSGIPAVSSRASLADHPFAIDLDITGERSLHQLIDTAISYEGSQRVCEWLLNTLPDLQTIRSRQALIQELVPLSRFRNKLTLKSILAAKNVAEQWEGKRLLSWLDAHAAASPRALRLTLWIATLLSTLTIILLLLNIFALLGPQFWIISLLLSIGWFYVKRGERGDLFEDAYFLRDAFAQLSMVLEYLETYPYGKHEHLKKLCEPFISNREHRPSTLLHHLSRIASAATLEKNQLLWLIVNVLLPWDIYVALRLNHYKSLIAGLLPGWLDTWFELEALNSLANFAYLNPEYTLAEVLPNTDQTNSCLFRAHGLGHPLIPQEQKVINDFAMSERGEVVIITGSNMSGKSTFLRTLGINLSLAYAGGPVNASAFQISLFKLYTCIKVSDSVTGGYSYFYAEVRRLKGLLTELERSSDFPLFFLIDEIFKGTNNREREIGSRAYIQALVGQNCMGAISTHDLELVKLGDTLPHIKNYHFREDVVDGRMVFDYILRPGPSPTTNALKIMQMEGLPIDVPV